MRRSWFGASLVAVAVATALLVRIRGAVRSEPRSRGGRSAPQALPTPAVVSCRVQVAGLPVRSGPGNDFFVLTSTRSPTLAGTPLCRAFPSTRPMFPPKVGSRCSETLTGRQGSSRPGRSS